MSSIKRQRRERTFLSIEELEQVYFPLSIRKKEEERQLQSSGDYGTHLAEEFLQKVAAGLRRASSRRE